MQHGPMAIQTAFYLDLLPQVLAHVEAGPHQNYRGWDDVLLRVATDLLRNQQDIAQTLDPQQQSPVIAQVSDNVTQLHAALPAYTHLQQDTALLDSMVMRWALHGYSPTAARLSTTLATLDGTVEAFPVSARAWVQDLAKHPPSTDASLTSVQEMTGAYASVAHEAEQVAMQANDTAFLQDVYNLILQKRPPLQRLQTYIATHRRPTTNNLNH